MPSSPDVTGTSCDVVVVGAGNAALCAALSARQSGARVRVLERAPQSARGGNSYFTAGLVRFPYEGLEDVAALVPQIDPAQRVVDVGRYGEKDYLADLERLTEGRGDPALASTLVREARPTMSWLRERGARFQLAAAHGRQAFTRDGVLRFWGAAPVEFAGGGREHVARLLELAARDQIEIWYDARATALVSDESGIVRGVRVERGGEEVTLKARAVILASGGFEANRDMRREQLGPRWADVKVRGTRFNTGDGIRMALAIGADRAGHWQGCHAVAWDANAPDFGDLRVTNGFNKHSYPYGITVNGDGERFLDEAADLRNYTYARYGAAILEQPGGVAFQIFDAKTRPLLREEYLLPECTRVEADSLEALALDLELPGSAFVRTVERFNAAVGDGAFDPTCLDGLATRGLDPPKSNWALPIDAPPYLGCPVACGITFTFGGLRVDGQARVLRADGAAIPGLFAAGELVGGLFWHNYPGGAGLAAGSVFGRIAGRSATQGGNHA